MIFLILLVNGHLTISHFIARQGYQEDIKARISRGYQEDIKRISRQGYQEDIKRISRQGYQEDIKRISRGYQGKDIKARISRGYQGKDIKRISRGYQEDIKRISRGYQEDIKRISRQGYQGNQELTKLTILRFQRQFYYLFEVTGSYIQILEALEKKSKQ